MYKLTLIEICHFLFSILFLANIDREYFSSTIPKIKRNEVELYVFLIYQKLFVNGEKKRNR